MAKRGRPKGSKNGQHKNNSDIKITVGKRSKSTTNGLRISAGKRAKNA